jgi:hypothetical protein
VGIGLNGNNTANLPQAKLHVGGNIIANDPTTGNHVATKTYVDSKVNSNGAWMKNGANIYYTITHVPHSKCFLLFQILFQ